MIRLLLFARLREQVGVSEEPLPAAAAGNTVADLIEHLRERGGIWAEALAPEVRIMAAVNQEMARPETPVADGDEVALFPPVTGG